MMRVSFVASLPSGDTEGQVLIYRQKYRRAHFRDVLLMMVSPASLTQHSLFPVYLLPLADVQENL